MAMGWYWLLGLSGALIVFIVALRFRIKFPLLGNPSYQDLLDEKARLKDCVVLWKYADGTHVPQHKRQRMFKDLHKLSQQIRKHPDNPANSGERQAEEQASDWAG
ncbi:hypothetical protein GPROT1_02350 [Gammaproteobacteria bacterium]|nr:hypothetical protein GPROT1_02350 [Gammaproteobacteria bacterium]